MPDQTATAMPGKNALPGRVEPALSATSDMPQLPLGAAEKPPEAKPETPPAETTEAKTEGAAETEQTTEAAPEKPKEPAADKTPAWQKAEITKERNRRREAEAAAAAALKRAETQSEQLATALKALEAATAKEAKKAEAPEPIPQRENFTSPDEYTAALIDYATKQSERNIRAELERTAAAEKTAADKAAAAKKAKEDGDAAAAENAKIAQAWGERREKAIAEKPDYAEVAEADDVPISETMANVIIRTPNGTDLAYHLGQNKADAARIAALPPAVQIFEMGQLAAKLSAPKPNLSKAPDPINTLKGRNRSTERTLEQIGTEGTMEEYVAAKRAREKAARGH